MGFTLEATTLCRKLARTQGSRLPHELVVERINPFYKSHRNQIPDIVAHNTGAEDSSVCVVVVGFGVESFRVVVVVVLSSWLVIVAIVLGGVCSCLSSKV